MNGQLKDYGWASVINRTKNKVGCLNDETYKQFKVGQSIYIQLINHTIGDARPLPLQITARKTYPSLKAMIEKEGLLVALPNSTDLEDATEKYRKLFTAAEEKKHGMIVFTLEVSEMKEIKIDRAHLLNLQEKWEHQQKHLQHQLTHVQIYLKNIGQQLEKVQEEVEEDRSVATE